MVGLTVGSAGGGLLLALVLVARRRLFASGAFLLAAVAVMASLAAPSARAQAAEDHEAVARATFSGLAGEVMVLDVSPDVDLNDRELPTLDAPWSIIKPLDQASPRLIDAVATGEEFRCVEFRFLTPDDQAVQGLIALAGVHVVKVRHVADGGEPVEHVELHYSRLAYRYRPQRPDGSLGPAVEGTRRGGPVG